MPPLLRFADVAPGRPVHAALVPVPVDPRPGRNPHSHADFHELFLVVTGSGTHWVAGRAHPVRAGDLVLVRPHDEHDFQGGTPGGMSIVNVAFPSTRWAAVTELAGAGGWDAEPAPVTVPAVPEGIFARFRDVLDASDGEAGALALLRLWAEVLPLLTRGPEQEARPAWLVAACAAMTAEEHLRAGLPRLRALASVSDGHLARSMAVHHGCTPVAFVTACRLEHAARLLVTTADPVGRVADRCGFGSQSYFARLFLDRFGATPRDHRERARRAVVPIIEGRRGGTGR